MSSAPHTLTLEQRLTQLEALKQNRLDHLSSAYLEQHLNKSNMAESYQQAFILLYQEYEECLQQATIIAFDLNAFQAKKILYKKDRIRLFKKHDIDFMALAEADAIHTLSLIVNALHYNGIVVTSALANKFPHWKEGFNMVQLDLAYKKLAPRCVAHYEALLEALIAQLSKI